MAIIYKVKHHFTLELLTTKQFFCHLSQSSLGIKRPTQDSRQAFQIHFLSKLFSYGSTFETAATPCTYLWAAVPLINNAQDLMGSEVEYITIYK